MKKNEKKLFLGFFYGRKAEKKCNGMSVMESHCFLPLAVRKE